MNNKTALRFKAKEIRKTLDIGKLSYDICKKLRENQTYKTSQNIMIYYPTKYELNLLSLLEDDKNFYLPKVCDDNLLVCPYKNGDRLNKSNFGVYEPVCSDVDISSLDLVIVPALMADKNGFRLGYGGGYYDRFLSNCDGKIYSICVVSKELFVKALPVEKFDISVNEVIYT